MDRRLDKRYLTGAVSAMEKQYGAEKTDAIIEDAWRRWCKNPRGNEGTGPV